MRTPYTPNRRKYLKKYPTGHKSLVWSVRYELGSTPKPLHFSTAHVHKRSIQIKTYASLQASCRPHRLQQFVPQHFLGCIRRELQLIHASHRSRRTVYMLVHSKITISQNAKFRNVSESTKWAARTSNGKPQKLVLII